MPEVRPLAICVFRHQDKILVCEGYDPTKDQTFYRPLGGRIEFGERSNETVHRELLEEIGAEVKDLVYLGALENIFTFDGKPGHEIVQVYDGMLVDTALYEQVEISGFESEVSEPMKVIWKRLDEFGPGKSILYPDGLFGMLNYSIPK